MRLSPMRPLSQSSRRVPNGVPRWFALGAMLAAGLAGCTVPRPPQTPVPPQDPLPPAAPATPADPAAQARVAALLDAAEQALAADLLTTPPEDNALAYYTEALALMPAHPAAKRGLERIVERYLELAVRAIDRQRWASARSMLARAALVDAEHPGIDPLRRQAEMLATAKRESLRVDRAALRARQGALGARLAAFGKTGRQRGARVTIRAPSDADARWIYAQLNRAAGERRIRASIEIGLPPQVDVLVLPSPSG